MNRPSIFELPGYRIGPYEVNVRPATRRAFSDKRRKAEHDWTAGVLHIDSSLDSARQLYYFLRALVTTIHYRSGLNDKCDEEAFTHSLSTGLVELARNNPRFWVDFQALLESELKPGAGWRATAAGTPPAHVHSRPKRVVHGSRTCTFALLTSTECERLRAYGFYTKAYDLVELSDGLRGLNLPVIAIHEVVHFLHSCEKLGDRSKYLEFRDRQTRMLLRFAKSNPRFWCWWLHTLNAAPAQLKLAA